MHVINPATEDVMAEVADADVADVERALRAAADAQPGWAITPARMRYYGQLTLADSGPTFEVGASAVFGYRIQAFVTRDYTAGISGLCDGNPRVAGIWCADGSATSWPT